MRWGSITASSGSCAGPPSAASIPSRASPTTIAGVPRRGGCRVPGLITGPGDGSGHVPVGRQARRTAAAISATFGPEPGVGLAAESAGGGRTASAVECRSVGGTFRPSREGHSPRHSRRIPVPVRQQLRERCRVDRLGQVVVEPRLERPSPVLLLAPAGQGDEEHVLAPGFRSDARRRPRSRSAAAGRCRAARRRAGTRRPPAPPRARRGPSRTSWPESLSSRAKRPRRVPVVVHDQDATPCGMVRPLRRHRRDPWRRRPGPRRPAGGR